MSLIDRTDSYEDAIRDLNDKHDSLKRSVGLATSGLIATAQNLLATAQNLQQAFGIGGTAEMGSTGWTPPRTTRGAGTTWDKAERAPIFRSEQTATAKATKPRQRRARTDKPIGDEQIEAVWNAINDMQPDALHNGVKPKNIAGVMNPKLNRKAIGAACRALVAQGKLTDRRGRYFVGVQQQNNGTDNSAAAGTEKGAGAQA